MEYNKNLFPFEEKWVIINGAKTCYIDEGEGPVLLFSHAPLGSSFMYREFIKNLRLHYRCIAFDFPGFGKSEIPETYTFDIVAQSQFLELFIEKLGLRDITLLGHDTGGPSAFRIASDYPNLFKGLILSDTIIFPVSEYKRINYMLSIVGSSWFQWINALTNFLVKLTFTTGIRTRKLSKLERLQYHQLFNTRQKRRAITQMLFSLKQNTPFMQKVKVGFQQVLNQKPVLLLYGEKDPVHQLGISLRINDMLPNSELHLIKNEGHFPHEGQPSFMSKLIHNWMQKIISQTEKD